MSNCATCKHWDRSNDCTRHHHLGLGICLSVKMLWDCLEWTKDFEQEVLKDECKNLKSFVQDGSDYTAHLITRHNFGCVSYEGKP